MRSPQTSPKLQAKRAGLIDAIADILLEQGVALIPLRGLAKQLGTSDRMLLYYFATQAEMIGAVLQRLSDRLSVHLTAMSSEGRLPPAQLLQQVSEALAQPEISATLRVWADVSARAARGEPPFADLAGASVSAWRAWAEQRLDVEDAGERSRTAAAILVVVEGVRLIEASAPGATDGVVELLAKAFEASRP